MEIRCSPLVPVESARDGLELHSYLGVPLVQCLAGLHEKWDALPSRVVDEEGRRSEGGNDRSLGHGLVIEVRGVLGILGGPSGVLVVPKRAAISKRGGRRKSHGQSLSRTRGDEGGVGSGMD